MGEDFYIFFILSFFANTYIGLKTRPYYHYRYGNGLSTRQHLTQAEFAIHGKYKENFSNLNQFLAQNPHNPVYDTALKQLQKQVLEYSLNTWFHCMDISEARHGFDILAGMFGIETVFNALRQRQWPAHEVAKRITGASALMPSGKPVKTIGIFYHRLYEGSVERVISLLIPLYIRLGYSVVLFTEKIDLTQEYPIPKEVRRVILPQHYHEGRGEKFAEFLKQYKVDMLFHHATSSDILFYDVMLAKGLGIPVVLHRHETSTFQMLWLSKKITEQYLLFRLADRIIVLSSIEEMFYQHLGCHAQYCPNPVDISIAGRDYSQNDGSILWIGRLDRQQKQYMDALKIMKEVVASMPKAQLVMTGGEKTKGAVNEIKHFIIKHRLQNNVTWHDYTPDVTQFTKKRDCIC